MTVTDRPRFNRALRDLAALMRFKDIEDQLDHYFAALERRLSIDDLEAVCAFAAQRAGTGKVRWFPMPGTLMDLLPDLREATVVARVTPAAKAALEQFETHCRDCDDTGWLITERRCDHVSPMYREGATRSYARPCPCRSTNPLWQAKRASRVQSAGRSGD